MVGLKAGKYATRDLILLTLREEGPLCSADLVAITGKTPAAIAGSVTMMRKAGLLRIAGWKRSLGSSGLPGAIWSDTPGRDVPKPTPDRDAVNRRYREKHKAKLRAKMRARRGVLNPYLQLLG